MEERGERRPTHCPLTVCLLLMPAPWLHSPGGLPNPPQGVESSVDPHVTDGRWEAEREPGGDSQAPGFVTR